MDRGVDRHPRKSHGYVCVHGMPREASLQARRVLRLSVLLLIRGFHTHRSVLTDPEHRYLQLFERDSYRFNE